MSAWLLFLMLQAASASGAPQPAVPQSGVGGLALVQPAAPAAAPLVMTLQDALERARQNDATFLAATADAALAAEDRAQARASMLPTVSYSTQYLGNSPTPNNVLPNGRFVSLDGTKMYRAWGIAHEDLSANVLLGTSLHRAQAAEAAAQAKLEVARRGLALTVTRMYYALVTAQRKYATAQQAAQQAQRFLTTTQAQQRLGQVARADSIKAEIAFQQQQQAFRDALIAMDNARLMLAVLLFPDLNENFTVVDDLATVPPLPAFDEVRTMAVKNNPDVAAADAALRAAGHDVAIARNTFLPTLTIEGVYGIESNEFALHSIVLDRPDIGEIPTLGYFLTVNLTVPVWDWGGMRSKLHQAQTKQRQAQVTLTQTQRQLMANLFSMYNESQAAKVAVDELQHVADLAAESLRLTSLRYEAGESTALEVVDAQTTLVQARNAVDDAQVRYRIALAELQTLTGRP
ncbi:MAG TPA: TolC family protein [Vicinamibacterales bacterium]|nr:TolC family protein [Vicinamibacterales bacterium]